MKAITICQPYAELIACGQKRIENRTWPTSHRGMIAIHAGKSREWLEGDEPDGMVFGAVVAVAHLVGCRQLDDLPPAWRAHKHALGPWCWMLSNARRVGPVPYRGAQGLWEFPDALTAPTPTREAPTR